VALLVRERLDALGLELYPVTSGSKGMQLYAALGGDLTSDQVRDLAMQLAQEMTKKHPDLVLWKMTKSLRPGKIFLDWSQNVAAKTTISPYSLRGRELPCVAAPRTWAEVERGAAEPDSLRQLMFDEVLERLDADGDLIADLP
jgi:bifunctional non-homologous end joining protein LigD